MLEASVGQYPNQVILTAYNLNMKSGDKQILYIEIETEHVRGHEFCLYDVSCTFQNKAGVTKPIKTGFQPMKSKTFPLNRIKVISLDENGKDINRFKTKSTGGPIINLEEKVSFMFGSVLQYDCGPGKSFELNETEANIFLGIQSKSLTISENVVQEKINISCNWNGQWSIPSFFVPKCVCE